MTLERLVVENCRNIREATLAPDEKLTVIAGQNGQGKTNLLECVWLLTGSRSFRGAKDMELVREGEAFGKIEGKITKNGRENRIELLIEGAEGARRGRFAKVNDVDYGRAGGIAGVFCAVVFEPGHLNLVKGGPEGRRRFLDAALCQLYPGYLAILRRFSRVLTQRNALLKKYHETADAAGLLDVFDTEMAGCGEEISRRRAEYLDQMAPAAEGFYRELAGGAEEMQMRYLPCCDGGALPELLQRARTADIRAGFSTAGPHREDFDVQIGARSARVFGSQGQQRSAVLSLKLAEASVAEAVTGEHPVMLLDDVLSELDESRQAYLLGRMDGKQSVVTTCDASAFARTAGLVVQVQEGRILV